MKKLTRHIYTLISMGVAALCLLVVVGQFLTPWPGVLLIRAAFEKGSGKASVKLDKHLRPGILVQKGVRYDERDPDAFLDVYRPTHVDPQAPTVVWVHGGGFVSGQRGDLTNYLKVLASRGFVTVNVDYTIAPSAVYPAPVVQISKALAFIDREGTRLGINRNALVLAGDSAGAQLAAQTANLITSPVYARSVGIAAPIEPKQLKGALLYCGVFDLGQLGEGRGVVLSWFVRTVTWAYSGKRDWREAPGFELASVVHYITPAFPRTFISAGNADPLGPQSVRMDTALRTAGVSVHSLFFPVDHEPKLGHEYQFDLDEVDGQRSLDESVSWLKRTER